MDPIQIEEDRDAVTAFFRAQPLHFEGNRRSVKLDAWLHDLEQIFLLCHIEEHLRVRLATRCLYNEARMWWIETGRQEVPDYTWIQFRVAIRNRFGPLPPRGLGAPVRDPEIYRDMRHTRYQLLSRAWHAYPGESMNHYGWRFREMMLPHVPQDLPEPELEAQELLRNGVPANIRQYVPTPTRAGNVISLMDDILQAEMTAEGVEIERQAGQRQPQHQDEAGPSAPPRDEAGPSTPRYEVGPLVEEDEPAVPAQEAEDPLADQDDVMPVDPPEGPPIPLIIISSDDEDDDFGLEDEDEDPEEFPDEEDEDLEEEPLEIIPDEGDEHANAESDSDESALSIELIL